MDHELSPASEYKQTFGTRRPTPGRPTDREPMFGTANERVHPVLTTVARRRAFSVVHDEQRVRLRKLFQSELRLLKVRGVETVAADAGIDLSRYDDVDRGDTHDEDAGDED